MNITEIVQIVHDQLGNKVINYVIQIKKVNYQFYDILIEFNKSRYSLAFDVKTKSIHQNSVYKVKRMIRKEMNEII